MKQPSEPMTFIAMDGLPNVLDEKHSALLMYWSSLRASDRSPPARRDIDPALIPNLLPYLWLCEREDDSGRFICRLAGEHTRVRYGKGLRSSYLNDFIHPEDFHSVNSQFNAIIDKPGIGFCHGVEFASDEVLIRFRGIVMPLCNAEKVKYVFGLSIYEEQYRQKSEVELSHTRTVTDSSLWPSIGAPVEDFISQE